jgi:hypothetical protein
MARRGRAETAGSRVRDGLGRRTRLTSLKEQILMTVLQSEVFEAFRAIDIP